MPVEESSINNIMSGIENTGGVKQHNHKKKLRQRFDIIRKLGQGTFGKVQLGINKETGQEVAIKTIKKSKIESEADLIRIRREIQIMSSVQHPNIIHIYEVFENREKMVLVMEYAAGGELYDYLSERKVLVEDEARRIFRQIATACYYCHKHKICHRDLKLENILLDENNNAKIADFGLSNVFDDQRLLSTFCGSPLYASPEIVKGTPYHGPEVDCWSLGVLLYTLVYGAMPFDGSNFKRLVKQISQGDYFEPAKPSPASPLIREMLTVGPKQRAHIEKICAHWWVNETYNDNCLDISEELANQTPVRLDVLLSLAPPPPQLESDKLVVTGDVAEQVAKTEAAAPTRSQSVGSLIEMSHPAEKRIKDLINDEKVSPKRKLETTVSTDRANLDRSISRKEKIVKENTVADISVHAAIQENASLEDASMTDSLPLNKSLTQTLSKDMDFEQTEETVDPSMEGAACTEILLEAETEKKDSKKTLKVKNTPTSNNLLEEIHEMPSQENVANNLDKENIETVAQESNKTPEEPAQETKVLTKRKVVKKKVLVDKNENLHETSSVDKQAKEEKQPKEAKSEDTPAKPIERRRSRIFEAAEKFQNMLAPTESKPMLPEKPKKIIIPGVSVDGFKKEFERKASLTSTSPPKLKGPLSKKILIDKQEPSMDDEESPAEPKTVAAQPEKPQDKRQEQVRNAVNIISTALDKEGTRKSKSRPCMMRKPPVPFGVSGRSASGNIGMIANSMGPKPFIKPKLTTEAKKVEERPEPPEEDKTSSAEITLKSATLPRRRTTKAEIQLNYPMPKPATMEFKTEMAHNVAASPKLAPQRSEVVVPVQGAASAGFRSTSLEPDQLAKSKSSPKERIIPISFEKPESNSREGVQSPPAKPPMPRLFQTQKSNTSQRSNSLSRQSTQDSETETVASTGEPIRKSPREYIIPIAVEGGGYVTPRAGSLEPSDTASTTSTMTNRSKLGRARRMNERDSEDESPFSTLHRHSSFGRDSDTEDSRRDAFHMHRLRSTRPKKTNLEHTDSLSSGEEDDDDGFEILTAENLFSTLLSRVRDLTQRLNVDDGSRPGFPSSRLLSHFDHGTNFFKRMDPLSRHSSLGRNVNRDRSASNSSSASGLGAPWRRSVSRDLATDIESIFNDSTSSVPPPKGDNMPKNENLNLADLDLKKLKLSEEDALALSYLTPGLSRRIQKQLLSQLDPAEVRKLHRTLSSCNSDGPDSQKSSRRSVDRLSSTLPRRFSTKKDSIEECIDADGFKAGKSSVPVKNRDEQNPHYEYNLRSLSIGAVPRNDSKFGSGYRRPTLTKSLSVREPRIYTKVSPDSSISESLSSSYNRKDDSISDSSASRPYSKYSSDSSSYNRYNTPSKSYDSFAATPTSLESTTNKTDIIKKPSTSNRKISRFLRPDFFDAPKEENVYLKEKKEREMETQKVLKEIRDKRKTRLNLRRGERSAISKEQQLLGDHKTCDILNKAEKNDVDKESTNTNNHLEKNIKAVNDYVNVPAAANDLVHDYVNVTAATEAPVVKKERTSKLARPKSYPAENNEKAIVSPDKESKISKLRKGFVRQPSKEKEKTKEDKNENNEAEKGGGHRNKLLQSIEKKLEKFRLSKDPEELKALQEKKSGVESAIKRLREQSLPRNMEHCTESGLIKRAVSVEDLTINSNKPLQASRKSVTKILGLFKKYEEQESKKKVVKKNKAKENGNIKSKKEQDCNNANGSVILSNNISDSAASPTSDSAASQSEEIKVNLEKKPERPRSLLFDKVKHFQNVYNGAKSDGVATVINDKERKVKSKLPVNSFARRSLNLDNLPEPPKFYKNPSSNLPNGDNKQDRKSLKLDLSRTNEENRHTDDSSTFLSPGDDYVSDSWSICSDLHSPISPNGHVCSGDENESVIDRIRRKSFYTRFNEKKRPRRATSIIPRNYKDIDVGYKRPIAAATDYTSERRAYDYRPRSNRSNYASPSPPKTYTRSSSLMNDYVNVPNRYQTYSSRIGRPGAAASLYSDSEDHAALDDILSTAKSRKFSPNIQPSRLSRTSVSPVSEQKYHFEAPSSSIASTSTTEPF